MSSWPIAIPQGSPFSLANIPFGIFSTAKEVRRRAGTAVGSLIVDLAVLEQAGLFQDSFEGGNAQPVFASDTLNAFAASGLATRRAVRSKIISLLSEEKSPLFTDAKLNQTAFLPLEEGIMHLPMQIGDFTDFMCSEKHVENCSRMAGAPVLPSYYAFPMAYNGRAGSVMVSGEPLHRPRGMLRDGKDFVFAPSKMMDFELEMGVFAASSVERGRFLTADEANDSIFGLVLLNDWSARDIQFAEMVPLGPFNGKASGTSITPWIVTLDALNGSAATEFSSTKAVEGLQTIASHLRHKASKYIWDIELTAAIHRPGKGELKLSHTNLRDVHWSPGQQLAHASSSGSGVQVGDLVGTGTISSLDDSPEDRKLGCLHELTKAGKEPLAFPDQSTELTWIEDGDEVVFEGWAKGSTGVGFGQLRSKLLPAL